MDEIKPFLKQTGEQRQEQHLSQKQIQAINFLAMSSKDLRDVILNTVQENPALEIVKDPLKTSLPQNKNSTLDSDDYQKLLENVSDSSETLQHHLIEQLKFLNLTNDEFTLCKKLIYNLDKDGFYNSMLAPKSFLDPSKPSQNEHFLEKCLSTVQHLDPPGTCCKDVFESLKIQAQIKGDADNLTLFILDGRLELLEADSTQEIVKNINDYIRQYKSKAFAKELPVETGDVTPNSVENTLRYIRTLNPHPAGDFGWDNQSISEEQADVVLTIEKMNGAISEDDFSTGKIKCSDKEYFQVKYASGILPEVRLYSGSFTNKKLLNKARDFLWELQFRENSIVLQGCSIVKNQLQFFSKGPGNIQPFTRRQLAGQINVHPSTVSRFSSKKNSKYIQTQWGTFPANYFFSSGIASKGGKKTSAEKIKNIMASYLETPENQNTSDLKLTKYLNQKGINISRRTVAKYRSQLGIGNSYKR